MQEDAGSARSYPVTLQGWLLAVCLMVIGIAMVGAITASMAARIVAQVEAKQRQATPSSDG